MPKVLDMKLYIVVQESKKTGLRSSVWITWAPSAAKAKRAYIESGHDLRNGDPSGYFAPSAKEAKGGTLLFV